MARRVLRQNDLVRCVYYVAFYVYSLRTFILTGPSPVSLSLFLSLLVSLAKKNGVALFYVRVCTTVLLYVRCI